jgi:hypothetical protein
LKGLAVQGIPETDRVFPVGDVNDVVLDENTVGIADGVQAPGADIVALTVKNNHGRLLPLKGVYPVLGVGGYRADHAEGLSRG